MRAPVTSPRSHDLHRGIRRIAAGLIGVCGVYQVAVGLYFIALRPALLPEDVRFLATGRASLHAGLPRLETWLHLVFIVLGGQMAAIGALLIGSSFRIFHAQLSGGRELALLGAAGALSVCAMAGVNFVLGSDFRWLLIVPVVAWSAGLVLAAVSYRGAGARVAKPAKRHGTGHHE